MKINTGAVKSALVLILGLSLMLAVLQKTGGGAYFDKFAPIVCFGLLIVAAGSAVVYFIQRRNH